MKREVQHVIRSALREDRAQKDVTSRLLIEPGEEGTATVVAKQGGVLCGVQFAAQVFHKMDPDCHVHYHAEDGARLQPGMKVMSVKGKLALLLPAERTAVNFIQHLSGVATLTARFVEAVQGTGAKIYDTRKTLPGIRKLQKYAVRCGGGLNHRLSLLKMAMVKDNHLDALKGREWKVMALREKLPRGVLLAIEARDLQEVRLALDARADIVLLDNMPIRRLKRAIRYVRLRSPKTQIEVTGGIILKNVRRIAQLGVDRISIGSITHSAPALDFSMELESALEPEGEKVPA